MRRMVTLGVVAAAVVAASSPSVWAHDAYTMDDLKALVEQESWQELLDHALDVSPSSRDETWRTYLESAAVGYLKAVEGTGNKDRAMTTSEELLVKHPILKRSRTYMEERARVGLEALKMCFRNRYSTAQCSERAEAFVLVDPTNRRLAFEAGKLIRLRGSRNVATRMFARAFEDEAQRSGCSDDQVVLAVAQVLGSAHHEPTLEAAKKVAFDYCWAALKAPLLEAFGDAGPRYLAATCPGFAQRDALTEFQLALCEESK